MRRLPGPWIPVALALAACGGEPAARASSPTPVPVSSPAPVPAEFTLAVGGGQAVGPVTVTFERVVSDSRCPVGAQCIWAGDAVVAIRAGDQVYELHAAPAAPVTLAGGIRLTLAALAPKPTTSGAPAPKNYRATFRTG